MVFPVVMYGCESWTAKKAERRRIDLDVFNGSTLLTLLFPTVLGFLLDFLYIKLFANGGNLLLFDLDAFHVFVLPNYSS